MALSGTSTLADAITEYKTTADWHDANDIAKAKRFVTACKFMIAIRAERFRNGQQTLEFNAAVVQAEMADAKRFIESTRDNRKSVLHTAFRNFRT